MKTTIYYKEFYESGREYSDHEELEGSIKSIKEYCEYQRKLHIGNNAMVDKIIDIHFWDDDGTSY